MNETGAIIIVIVCYGLAIYLKLISIQKELSDIKHVGLNMIGRTLKLMNEMNEVKEE